MRLIAVALMSSSPLRKDGEADGVPVPSGRTGIVGVRGVIDPKFDDPGARLMAGPGASIGSEGILYISAVPAGTADVVAFVWNAWNVSGDSPTTGGP
jgi:hypothetical protein